MRLALLAALVLAACTQPPDIIVQQAAVPEPPPVVVEPVPEPEPVPAPDPGHIWILDADDALVYDCEAGAWADAYSQLLRAVQLTIEDHNRDNPASPWHYVEGGPA